MGPAFWRTSLPTIRESLEQLERESLAPEAAKSADSRGRLRPEPEDDVRPAFQHDRDRIIHSKAFRRLKHKTQVFFSPAGDHYRTRSKPPTSTSPSWGCDTGFQGAPMRP